MGLSRLLLALSDSTEARLSTVIATSQPEQIINNRISLQTTVDRHRHRTAEKGREDSLIDSEKCHSPTPVCECSKVTCSRRTPPIAECRHWPTTYQRGDRANGRSSLESAIPLHWLERRLRVETRRICVGDQINPPRDDRSIGVDPIAGIEVVGAHVSKRGSDCFFPDRAKQRCWNGNPHAFHVDRKHFSTIASGVGQHGLYFGDAATLHY